ncbi:MAG: hypothetical protein ACK5TO_03545 [Planctomycetaceae bacterium]
MDTRTQNLPGGGLTSFGPPGVEVSPQSRTLPWHPAILDADTWCRQ